jgi:hypothetical protein
MGCWSYKNGVFGVYGFVEELDSELWPSRLANTATSQKRSKDAQARTSNAQKGGVIVDGQKIAQRLVFWKLLGTGEDPGDMHRRVLGRCNKHKGKR